MERHEGDTAPGRDVAAAVTAFLTGGDPRGYTPAEIVAALDLPIAATALQGDLERLVAHDTLARWGIGRGALYILSAPSTGRSSAKRADAATKERPRGPGRGETAMGAAGRGAPTLDSI